MDSSRRALQTYEKIFFKFQISFRNFGRIGSWYRLIDDYSVSQHIFLTFLWNLVCYDYKVKVMKGL